MNQRVQFSPHPQTMNKTGQVYLFDACKCCRDKIGEGKGRLHFGPGPGVTSLCQDKRVRLNQPYKYLG